MSMQGINVTSYLRWSLISVVVILCMVAIFTALFRSETIKQELFDASFYPEGNWESHLEYFVFRYFADTKMEIVNDPSANRKFLRVHLTKSEVYKGFGFTKNLRISSQTSLFFEWRFSGNTTGIQVDIKDQEDTNSRMGEVFSYTILSQPNQWNISEIPVNQFVRNEFQDPNNPNDGELDNNSIQSVEFACPPNDEVIIDIRQVYFVKTSPKWYFIAGMVLIGGIGIVLFIQTSREFLSVMPDENYFSGSVSFRLMYIVMTLTFVHAVLYESVDSNWFVPAYVFSTFYFLLFIQIILPIRLLQSVYSAYIFLLLFAAGWWLGYPNSAFELLLFLLTTSIPFIQYKYNILLYLFVMTIIIFVPLFLNPAFHLELQNMIFVYVFFMGLIAFSFSYQMNLLTKIKAENTATLYEELFNHTSDAIFSYHANRVIDNANHGFENLLGKSREELIGTKIQDWVLPEDQSLLPMNQLSGSDELRKYDLRFIHQSGKTIYTNIIERAKIINGGIASYQVIARDITKRKQIEQLEKQKELAEQANAFKTRFLSSMTHEIRTPLHGVLSAVDILSSLNLTEEQATFTGIAKSSGKMLLELVNGILDYSKIESGKFKLHQDVFDLPLLIREITGLVAKQAEEKQLKFDVNMPVVEEDFYYGDSLRIRQILTNLLGNAIKFTEQGSISTHISIIDDTNQSTRFRFAVTDTGIGIASENLDSIFDVFSQVDSSYTRIHGGSGLGLAISKELAQLMGGKMGVESELGKGSTFWFEIALNKESAEIPQLFR